MIDLERLFKIRPFIFFVREDYYAFGAGVCKICKDGQDNPISLEPRYIVFREALNRNDISQKEAWEIYHKVNAEAEFIRINADPMRLFDQFEDLQFTDKEKDSIQEQLKQLAEYYEKHKLFEYCLLIV